MERNKKIDEDFENKINYKTRKLINQEIDLLDKTLVISLYEAKIWIKWLEKENSVWKKQNIKLREGLLDEQKEEFMKEIQKINEELTKIKEEKLTCPLCFKKFENIKSFTNHIRAYRKKLERCR